MNVRTRIWSLFASSLLALGVFSAPVKIVFDTDMIGDYDDVGAMAVLHKLADAEECDILATVSSTHSNASVGTIELLNRYYGRPDVPVGAVKGDGVGGGSEHPHHRSHAKYEWLLKRYPGWWRHRNANDAPDATDVYRQVLSVQPDAAVTIVVVGHLTNLRKLLESKADRHSPLDGMSLVKAKVRALYVMGGKIPRGSECNLMGDAASSKVVFAKWPTPLIVDDFWFSVYIYGGRKVAELPDDGNPVRDIFARCLPPREKCPPASAIIPTGTFKDNVKEGHNCFDQSCVLAAVRGPGSFFRLVPGRMEMVGEKGENVWTPDPKGPHAAMAYLDDWPRERMAAVIDDLMTAPPGKGKAQWVNLGSNTGLFGFDWNRAGVDGLNLAGSPQSMRRSVAKLKAHRGRIAKGAYVIFPISPFTAILPEAYDRKPSAPGHSQLAFDGTPSEKQFVDSRESLIKCWKDQFEIADFNDPMTARNRASYVKMVAFARESIAWCRAEGLRPVFVYPPMAKCFDGVFPEKFERVYIRDFLRDVGLDVPFFDYRNDPAFRDDGNFANSLFLNRTGCAKLTAMVMHDVLRKRVK